MEGWDWQWVLLQGTRAERAVGPALTLGGRFLLCAWTPVETQLLLPQYSGTQRPNRKRLSISLGKGLEEKSMGLLALPPLGVLV